MVKGRLTHNRKGSLLITCLIAMAVISLLGFSLFHLSYKSVNYSYHNERSVKAFHLAQAGISVASATLADNFSNKDDSSLFPETNLSGGSYDVTILQPKGQVVIQSVGKVLGVERTIYVGIKPNVKLNPLDYALFSNNKGTIRGNPNINGSIHTNGDWKIRGNAIIKGTASAKGKIKIKGKPKIGNISEGAASIEFPTYDFNTYFNLAAPEDRYTGDQKWKKNTYLQPKNGVIYVDGDVRISGNLELIGGIVATGKIKISGTVNQTGVGNLPAFMSRDDDIRILGNVETSEGLIYSATSDIRILGSVTGKGNIIAFDEIRLLGNVDFSVDSGSDGNGAGNGFTKLWYAEK